MRNTTSRVVLAALIALGLAACSDTETKYVITEKTPACSAANPAGACDGAGNVCNEGACVAKASLCSASNTSGTCPGGWSCYAGGCIPAAAVPQACGATVPNGTCATGQTCVQGTCLASNAVCSPSNLTGACPTDWACFKGGCVFDPTPVDPCTLKVNTAQPVLKFSSDFITTNSGKPTGAAGAAYTYDDDANTTTPAVEVPYTRKVAITVEGLQFRDLNGNGTLEKYEDWRYSPICRAKDLAARMAIPEKVALMGENSGLGGGNNTGILTQSSINYIFISKQRYPLVRVADLSPDQLATYINNAQALAEGMGHGIPITATADPVSFVTQSTSAAGAQSVAIATAVSNWPNQMGLGAINDVAVSFQYGDTVRKDLMGQGIRWQMAPMVDTVTEPRWARWQNTLGENALAVAKHAEQIVLGMQAGRNGLAGGVGAAIKHYPGHGPEQGGKDSHITAGQYNVYPGGMFEYHVIPFQRAIDAGAAAVMPCYSITKGITDWNPEQVGVAYSHGLITRLLKNELGFDGLVTSDWGVISGFPGLLDGPHGVESLTVPERAAVFVKAGSHQIGLDSVAAVQSAYDQGLLTAADIDGAAEKILELSYKLGLFENPYTSTAVTALARSGASMQAGFDAQKKAIVLLRNASAGAGRLPISQTRFTDVAGGTTGAPDLGEFASDANKNGTIEVWYDGIVDALHGADRYSTAPISALADLPATMKSDYDYRAVGAGTAGVAGFSLPVVEAVGPATADIAVLRITARKGTFNLDMGVPLSFDAPYPGFGVDAPRAAAVKDAQKVIDLFRIRDGYRKADGSTVAATNANLKIVLVMFVDRPGIVKPFVNGLTTLDERAGCDYTTNVEACYPVVSDEANVNPSIVTATTATAHAGVDTFLAEFGAYDRALLDFLFRKNVPATPAGYAYGAARLPFEFPSSDAAVAAQFEDVPADSVNPTFNIGAGSALPAQ